MSSNLSYKKKVLDALFSIAFEMSDPTEIDFKMLASRANISVKNIESEFKDMSELFYEASIQKWGEHQERSKKISKLAGVHAIPTLLKHDLSLVHYYVRDVKNFEAKNLADTAFEYVKNYIENIMPTYYFDILRYNPELLPHRDINAKLYANFIVHSMFFFAKQELKEIEPSSAEISKITRKLITSLFSKSREKLKIE